MAFSPRKRTNQTKPPHQTPSMASDPTSIGSETKGNTRPNSTQELKEAIMSQPANPPAGELGTQHPVFFGLPGIHVAKGAHIAYFFKGQEERLTLLAPFLKAGLKAGDQCLLVTEQSAFPNLTDYCVTDHLIEQGVDVVGALDREQLVVYEGSREVEEMAAMFASLRSKAKRAGRGQMRIAGDMTWALSKMVTNEKLLEWEAYFDGYVGSQKNVVALCQYDHDRFSGTAVMGALRTHPSSVIGGIPRDNPFHQDADIVLNKVYRRSGSPENCL